MLKSIVSALPLIVVITIGSALLVYLRAPQLGASSAAPASVPVSPLSLVLSYTAASLIFGVAAVVVYRLMEGRYAAEAAGRFFRLGLGVSLVLSVLAVTLLPMMKRGGAVEYVALNLLWGLGYGWFLPRLLG